MQNFELGPELNPAREIVAELSHEAKQFSVDGSRDPESLGSFLLAAIESETQKKQLSAFAITKTFESSYADDKTNFDPFTNTTRTPISENLNKSIPIWPIRNEFITQELTNAA